MSLSSLGQSIIEGNDDAIGDNENERQSAKTVSTTPKEDEFVLNGSKLADYIEINQEDLTFYERCGKGSYGSVYRGLWKSRNKIVAIKKLLHLDNNEAEVRLNLNYRIKLSINFF
jgi:hypothetical protein